MTTRPPLHPLAAVEPVQTAHRVAAVAGAKQPSLAAQHVHFSRGVVLTLVPHRHLLAVSTVVLCQMHQPQLLNTPLPK